jgi:cytochrome d ubiquinol oxidase subunit II
METLWYGIVALMLAAYVLLDGFDLGAGAVHLLAARTDSERRMVLKAIGPVWDGNEVWLLAAGGTLYFAFPAVYASSFSGFYLPLMMVLWLLMIRAIGIEFRSHVNDGLWRSFFDVAFSISSTLLALFFGAALGNVIRGVPLNSEGYFFEPLWTTFTVSSTPGILDWYTVLTGLIGVVVLASHGSLYIAAKTSGELGARSRRLAEILWWGVALLTLAGLAATLRVRPQMMDNYKTSIIWFAIPALVLSGLIGMTFFRARGKDRAAFGSSCVYIAGMLVGAAFGLYPNLLPASTEAQYGLTVHNSAASHHGLAVALVWWSLGTILVTGYFFYIYRTFRGKINASEQAGETEQSPGY